MANGRGRTRPKGLLCLVVNDAPERVEIHQTQELVALRDHFRNIATNAALLAEDARLAEDEFYSLIRLYADETGIGPEHPCRDDLYRAVEDASEFRSFAGVLDRLRFPVGQIP